MRFFFLNSLDSSVLHYVVDLQWWLTTTPKKLGSPKYQPFHCIHCSGIASDLGTPIEVMVGPTKCWSRSHGFGNGQGWRWTRLHRWCGFLQPMGPRTNFRSSAGRWNHPVLIEELRVSQSCKMTPSGQLTISGWIILAWSTDQSAAPSWTTFAWFHSAAISE